MGSNRPIAFLALVLIVCAHVSAAVDVPAAGVVLSRCMEGTLVGNGFFVGDGTWFVTARPLVFPRRPMGIHQGEAMVTVLSPYLGEAAEAQIVAQDQQWDLVVLRVPWKGHPAYALASDADIVEAAQVQVIGFPGVPSAARSMSETLRLGGVVVQRGMTRAIITASAPESGRWVGAALVLSGHGEVAGCYVRTQADGMAGTGVAAGPIRRLIEQTGVAGALEVSSSPLAPGAQAGDATSEYLQAMTASLAGEHQAALGHLQAFVKLRPQSAIGHRDLAGRFYAMQKLDDAQVTYAKALQLDPQLVSARVLYGQLLHERIMPRAAEEHLRYAWQHGRGSNAAVIPLCNVLKEQRKEAENLQILEQALKQNPLDGQLWNYLGQNRRAIDDHAGAATAFARAADLLGDDELSRVQAAEEFKVIGQPARAEEQYRILIEHNEQDPTAHYLFARLIARNRSREGEALKHAELALNLSNRPGAPPRNVVQSLIAAIRAGRVSPADELRL